MNGLFAGANLSVREYLRLFPRVSLSSVIALLEIDCRIANVIMSK
jgi:hypothetical protein